VKDALTFDESSPKSFRSQPIAGQGVVSQNVICSLEDVFYTLLFWTVPEEYLSHREVKWRRTVAAEVRQESASMIIAAIAKGRRTRKDLRSQGRRVRTELWTQSRVGGLELEEIDQDIAMRHPPPLPEDDVLTLQEDLLYDWEYDDVGESDEKTWSEASDESLDQQAKQRITELGWTVQS